MPDTTIVPTRPSIAEIFREVLSTVDDRSDVIDAVVAAIAPEERELYLRDLLSARFASEVSTLRNRAMPSIRRGATKRDLIRDDYWVTFLSQRVFVAGEWKVLRDTTADDLREIASSRRSQAAELLAHAEHFEALAAALEVSGAVTLGQMNAADGESAIGRAV